MTDQLITELEKMATTAPALAINAAIAVSEAADAYVTRPSPVGTLYVSFSRHGVSSVELADSPQDFEETFARLHGRPALPVDRIPRAIERYLDEAIAKGKPGRLPLDFGGLTAFQRAVLEKAAEIPTGEVRPYGWIAKEIGKPGAVRAVGSALAKNPVPVVVPCHRVVRSDGQLGNYSLGDPHNKRVLLEAEGLDLNDYESLADRGIRFTGSDTTKIFCNPSCGPAVRTTDQHRVEFRSESEARDQGYRPCKVCRPVTVAA
jgi:O-6-methylguanine DNA methyltransferase